jgi:hypothetical protein
VLYRSSSRTGDRKFSYGALADSSDADDAQEEEWSGHQRSYRQEGPDDDISPSETVLNLGSDKQTSTDQAFERGQIIILTKSSLQILWLLAEDAHLETKRSNEGNPESERGEARLCEPSERRLGRPLDLAV